MVHLGAGGIVMRGNETLLLQRSDTETFRNIWSNPGGTIDAGETAEAACIREFSEELGIVVKIISKLSDYYDYKDGILIGKYTGFYVEIVAGVPKIMEPKKHSDLRYWPINSLPKNVAPYTQQYLKNLRI